MRLRASRSAGSPAAPRNSPDGQRSETFLALPSAQRGSRKRRSASLRTNGRCGKASTWPLSTTASTLRVGPASLQVSSGYSRTTGSAVMRASSTDAQAGYRAGVRLEDEQSRMRFLVAVRSGKHHAFTEAELHLAWRQVGDDYGEFADELFGRIGRLDAAEDGAMGRLADVERQAQQLRRAFDFFAGDDLRDAQVELGEVVDGDGRRDRFAAGQRQRDRLGRCAGWIGRRLEQEAELDRVDSLHQVLIRSDSRRQLFRVAPDEVAAKAEQLSSDAPCQGGQDRREQDREQPEPVQRARADVLQLLAARNVLGKQPGLRCVEARVDAVGGGHDVAQRLAVFPRFVVIADGGRNRARALDESRRIAREAQFPGKALVDEIRCPT